MANSLQLLDPRTLAKLKGLRLRALRIVDGLQAGIHRSPDQGVSIEFAEHRDYAPGDDLRYIDWKLYGRSDKFYLKRFEDETNLIAYLLVDSSDSMAYRSNSAPWTKWECAQCSAAALAWLAIQNQDSAGLGTFDDALRQWLEPSSSSTHLQPLIKILEQTTPQRRTSAGRFLQNIGQRLPRRGVVLILSDLLDDPDEILRGLRLLHQQRHDIGVLHILDPAELSFPFDEPMLFHGLEEAGDVPVDTRLLRSAYLQEVQAYLDKLKRGCQAQGVRYALLRTDQPLDLALASMLTRTFRRGGK